MNKRSAGRPKLKYPKQGYEIYLFPQEKKKLEDKAKKFDMTFSAFVRSIVLREVA